MAIDLIERLQSHMGKADMGEVLADCRLAADEITALRERVAALEGALRLWMETDIVSDDGIYRGAHWIGMLRGGDVAQAAEATVTLLSNREPQS